MNSINTLNRLARHALAGAICASAMGLALAGPLGPTVDDFSDPDKNSLSIGRQFIDDTTAGGKTKTQYSIEEGVLSAKGQISPPRGQPGWASTVLLLDPKGLPQDASAYDGIRLRIRINQGSVSISANSSEITNYDYHSTPVAPKADGKFHVVEIPFAQLKRVWSEQTPLNTKTLTSLSVVAFGMQPGSFDFQIDEVSFY